MRNKDWIFLLLLLLPKTHRQQSPNLMNKYKAAFGNYKECGTISHWFNYIQIYKKLLNTTLTQCTKKISAYTTEMTIN